MRKPAIISIKILAFLFILIGGAFPSRAQTDSGILFEHGSFAEACEKAKAVHKLIFVDFWAAWCGPCMYMKDHVFKEKPVGDYFNSHFINLKAESGKNEWDDLFAKYNIKSLPVFMFVDYNGAIFLYKAHDWLQGPALVEWAENALREFIDPGSLPRLDADYPSKKGDTAFLKKYLDKRLSMGIPSYSALDQYLTIQTAIPTGSRAMLRLLLTYRMGWYYGGKAAAILEKREGDFRRMANSAELEQLEEGKAALPGRTLDYAKEAKSKRLVRLYITEQGRAFANTAASDKMVMDKPAIDMTAGDVIAKIKLASILSRDWIDPATFQEKTWLDYYIAMEDWKQYRQLADKALDRICSQLQPDPVPDRDRHWDQAETPEESHTNGMARMVSNYARVYVNQFGSELGVQDKVLHWMKIAASAYPCDPDVLSRYANVLYQSKDITEAIRIKKRALKNMPVDMGAPLVQTNLEHMQKGEPLEEETNLTN